MRPALPSLASLCLFTACAAPDLHTERLDLTDLPGVSETPEDVPVMAMWSTTPGSKTDSAVGTALVALLDAAGHSIDASAYEISDPAIVDALLRAWDRGVHVRLVSDADEADGAGFAAITEAGIPVALRPAGDRIMHDKFIVVDRQAVWTGSTNLTPTGLLRNDNDAVLIESPDLAAAYTAELDQMAVDGAFGTAKNDLAGPRDFEVDAAQVTVHFAPQHDPIQHLIAGVDAAEHSIRFLIFSFTHPDLRDALIRAHERGVEVVGVVDESQAAIRWSVDDQLAAAGISVFIDGNHENRGWSGGKLHHKLMLIDGDVPGADPVLITGSFNWSRAATRSNDENLVEIREAKLQSQAQALFCDRLAIATPHPDGPAEPRDPCHAWGRLVINEVMPNPVGTDRGQEYVEIVNAGATTVSLAGWSIGDARADDRHVFRRGTLQPGEGVVVFDRGDHAHVPASCTSTSSFLSLNNSGDTVSLRAPDGAVIDTVRYGASRDGESWNRASDGTPGAALIPHGEVEGATEPQSPGTLANGRGFLEGPRFELVINEVMPDPVGRDRGQEYVEIVNLGPDAAPLEGITLSDGNGLRHRFGPEMLAAGRALVLFDQGDHAGIPGARSATTGFLSLNNTGDTLTMSSRDGELMDFVAWDDAGPGESWTRAEDGDPGAPLVLHGDVSPDGRLASPGTRLDGSIW